MSMERAGGIALALGATAYIALMAVHPSHAGGPPVFGVFSLSGVVHAVALTINPVLVFGFWVFTRHLGLDRPLPVLAFSFFALSAVFTMLAGTMSGLVFPYLMEAAHAPGADIEAIQAFGRYSTWLNRSFAQVHYDIASIAILLWCIAWRAESPLTWIARVLGAAVALGILGWQLSGTMSFEARQGALILTLAQGIWTLFVAVALFTNRPKS